MRGYVLFKRLLRVKYKETKSTLMTLIIIVFKLTSRINEHMRGLEGYHVRLPLAE